MKKGKDIEELFKDTFQNFEAPVDPAVWAGVQSGITGGSAAGAGGFSLIKALIIGAVAAGVITTVVLVSSGDTAVSMPEQEITEVTVNETNQEVEEKQPLTDKNEEVQVDVTINDIEELEEDQKEKEGVFAERVRNQEKSIIEQEFGNGGKQDVGTSSNDGSGNGRKSDIKDDKKAEKTTTKQIFTEGSVVEGVVPLRVNYTADNEDAYWEVLNMNNEPKNAVVDRNFEHMFKEPGNYLIRVVSDGQTEEVLVIAKAEKEDSHEDIVLSIDENVLSPDGSVAIMYSVPSKQAVGFSCNSKNVNIFSITIVQANKTIFEYSGDAVIDWNGLDNNGNRLVPGTYQMVVIVGDANGNFDIRTTTNAKKVLHVYE